MTRKRAGYVLITLSLLVAITLSGNLIGGSSFEEDPNNGIAFIDLTKVLNAHKGLDAVNEQIAEINKNGQAVLARLQEEFNAMKNELSIFTEESEEYAKGLFDLEQKELSIKQADRRMRLERDRLLSQALRNAYSDVARATREYARQKGLGVIFSGNLDIDQVKTNNPADILRWISMVNVVWNDDRLDISEAIINIVNG